MSRNTGQLRINSRSPIRIRILERENRKMTKEQIYRTNNSRKNFSTKRLEFLD